MFWTTPSLAAEESWGAEVLPRGEFSLPGPRQLELENMASAKSEIGPPLGWVDNGDIIEILRIGGFWAVALTHVPKKPTRQRRV